jgi:hypothetical protein
LSLARKPRMNTTYSLRSPMSTGFRLQASLRPLRHPTAGPKTLCIIARRVRRNGRLDSQLVLPDRPTLRARLATHLCNTVQHQHSTSKQWQGDTRRSRHHTSPTTRTHRTSAGFTSCDRQHSIMILPQVHLRKPCYDFYFL